MHLPPEIWGPIFWSCFHLITLSYPDNPTFAEQKAAKDFFNSMMFLLPCAICREHYKKILQGTPVDTWLNNRNSLIEWGWMLHNQVNMKLNKKQVSKKEFFDHYAEMSNRGLPVPPSSYVHDITATAEQAAWIRGAATVVGALVVTTGVGALIWISYNGKK